MDKGICVYSIVSVFNQYSIPWLYTVTGFGCSASKIKYKWMSNKLFNDSVVGKCYWTFYIESRIARKFLLTGGRQEGDMEEVGCFTAYISISWTWDQHWDSQFLNIHTNFLTNSYITDTMASQFNQICWDLHIMLVLLRNLCDQLY